jgi:hypothetical protein
MYTDKITQAVAEAVKQILATEKLHPNQQKLDVHEPEKDELTSNDFKMLRKGKKADVKEGWQDMLDDVKKRAGPQPSGGSGVKQGSRYGGSKQKDEPEDKKPMKEEIEQIDELSPELLFHAMNVAKAKGKQGDAEHYAYQTNRLRHGFHSAYDRDKKNGTYDQRKAAALKKEDTDINAINGVKMSTIEEKQMTEPEMKKREEIVKSMKKGLAGFKERYGDRAKDVMYATATKQAMKD